MTVLAGYVTLCRGLTPDVLPPVIEAEKTALGLPTAGDPGDIIAVLAEALLGEASDLLDGHRPQEVEQGVHPLGLPEVELEHGELVGPRGEQPITFEKTARGFVLSVDDYGSILQAAWVIEHDGYGAARRYVAACKVKAAEIQREMAFKATHIHGALGTTNTLPITRGTDWLGIADGPTEVHKVTIARSVLKEHSPSEGLFPSAHLPPRQEAARKKFANLLEHEVAQH